ncbi:MAG: hypothetical protein ACD_39C00095G0011 [uncultured bacterium]|nr:MAG: hypothetical protein ACD_39C00095G0011 [uncultured bacterium]
MDIKKILQAKGPLTTSAVKRILVESGISDDAARKRISRVSDGIKKYSKIQFPKNIQLLYLPQHLRASASFRKAILSAFKETGAIHHHALQAIVPFGGLTTKQNFMVLSGCPADRKKKTTFEKLLKELVDSDVVSLSRENGVDWVLSNCSGKLSSKAIKSISIIQTIHELLFNPIEDWLKKNSLVSYNKLERFNEFAGYYWHLTAPSYLLPLIKKSATTTDPGFVVVDILPQNDIQVEHIKYFICKCSSCVYQKNIRPFLPILIGNQFSHQALQYAKENNILITTPRNLFGDEMADAIDNLIRILTDTAKFLKTADEKTILEVFTKIAKIEGKTNNIKGQLFELVAGHIVSNDGFVIDEIGRKICNSNGDEAEIDVLARRSKTELKIIECKGFSSKSLISQADIEKWFKQIKRIRDWVKNQALYVQANLTFEYWTSSGFTEDAESTLKAVQAKLTKYSIHWRAGKDVTKYAQDLKLGSMVNLLREHYVKDVFY